MQVTAISTPRNPEYTGVTLEESNRRLVAESLMSRGRCSGRSRA